MWVVWLIIYLQTESWHVPFFDRSLVVLTFLYSWLNFVLRSSAVIPADIWLFILRENSMNLVSPRGPVMVLGPPMEEILGCGVCDFAENGLFWVPKINLDALRDLVLFAQFKKTWKTIMEEC